MTMRNALIEMGIITALAVGLITYAHADMGTTTTAVIQSFCN